MLQFRFRHQPQLYSCADLKFNPFYFDPHHEMLATMVWVFDLELSRKVESDARVFDVLRSKDCPFRRFYLVCLVSQWIRKPNWR